MSGDVQPRKRKDKRRKKEGGSLGSIHDPITSNKFKKGESDERKIFELPDQGEKIHVQNEHGIGGNICVKIIFFCLLGLLVGAVGLIYLQSQGSTDVDLPTIEESRFSEYFTGWLDDSTDEHELEVDNQADEDHEEGEGEEEHEEGEGEEEHEEGEGEEEHEEREDESPEQDLIHKLFGMQENENDEDEIHENYAEPNEEEESQELEEKQDVDDEVEDEVDEDEEEEEEEDEEEKTEKKEEEEEEEEEEETEEKEEDEEVDDEEADEKMEDSGVDLDEDGDDDDDDDDEEYDISQMDENEDEDVFKKETKYHVNGKKNEIDVEEKDDDQDNDDEEAERVLKDEKKEEEEQEEELSAEEIQEIKRSDDLGYDEIEESEEGEEEEEQDERLKFVRKADKGDSEEKEVEEESVKAAKVEAVESESMVEEEEEAEWEEKVEDGGVAVKLGVGIALIIVAHLVLVQKWKSMGNAPSDDEKAADEISETVAKKEIANLSSQVEPITFRRQTLVPEDVYLNRELGDEEDEIMEEEEEEEEEENDDDDEEVEEEEEEDDDEEVGEEEEAEEEEISEERWEEEKRVEKKKNGCWEVFEKPYWKIEKQREEEEEDIRGDVEDDMKNVDLEEEDEEEEEEEEEDDDDDGDDDDEEYGEEEEDDYEEEKNVNIKKLKSKNVEEVTGEEEVKDAPPIPPPRAHRGPQEFYEDFTDREERNVNDRKSEEPNNVSEAEEQMSPERKAGNEEEWSVRQRLDFADEQFENNPKAAVKAFEEILSEKPKTMRALMGRARALDHLAEKEKSNAYLKQAISAYKSLLLDHGHLLQDDVYLKLAERCIERIRFGGAFASAIDVHKALILRFPETAKHRNGLAVTYLMLNKVPLARRLLNETLSLWPDDGFALAHYGFILKTTDNDMERGARNMMAGIRTREEGVIDGMFFFHLGDALNRLGRGKEAMEWYELGVKEGLFLNKYQRSLYNVDRLKGQPWWTKKETTYQDFFEKLEMNWREIRKEGLNLLNSNGVNLFKEEAENLKDTGDWRQLDLFFRGRKQASCSKAPVTCSLVSSFKPASTCTRGQIKFSVMLPNTHVWPHCGPTNCRLRSHLGLVVPKKTYIRVAEETRSWEEGKFIIFDDSFEHEVWHNGTGARLVLIVDVWHPELTDHERRTLSAI